VKRIVVVLLTLASVLLSPGAARAQELSIWIEKDARLTADGSITFTVHVTCELPGTVDLREGLAGAGQTRTGAATEGGLSPEIICDGVERVYTGGDSLLTEQEFKRGPAIAHVTVFACNFVGDQQVCVHASAQRRVIVSSRPA
jgi:hypothetical protein